MNKQRLKKISLAALFAALIAVFTAFIKIPTGINEGYLHFGDSMIYLASCLLGPYAAAAAAIGGALADIVAGAAIWAPATAIIKALNSIPFIVCTSIYLKKSGKQRIINLPSVIMTLVSGIITVLGYFVAEGLMFSFESALTSVPFSIIQAVGSAVVFIAAGCALDAVKIRKLINI